MTPFWWGLCLDNLPLSKFFSLPILPAPPPLFLSLSCQAYFINGSSWRSFSGIQGLLPFGVFINLDAWNIVKTLPETITIQAGDHGTFQGPDGWVQVGPQGAWSTAHHRSEDSGPWRTDWEAVNRAMVEGALHDFSTHLTRAPLSYWT